MDGRRCRVGGRGCAHEKQACGCSTGWAGVHGLGAQAGTVEVFCCNSEGHRHAPLRSACHDLANDNTPLSRQLGQMDTGGLNNYMATISRDGRWVAAGTFTSDVKVGWKLLIVCVCGGRAGTAYCCLCCMHSQHS